MKRTVVNVLKIAAVLSGFALSSCDMDESESSGSSVSAAGEIITSTSTTASWDASSSGVFEVETGVTTVNITGATSGKTLYLVKRNTGSTPIATKDQPYVSGSSSSRSAADTEEIEDVSDVLCDSEDSSWHCYIPPEPEFSSSGARSASDSSSSVTQIDPVVGETTKSIYVDTDSSLSNYEQKTATLYAEGAYCYVWIVDEYYNEIASGKYVNQEQAQELADAFDSLYNVERNIFGKESEYIYSNSSKTAITSASDTGSMVNIVLYDIAADYDTGSSSGVAGYFYSRDYYKASVASQSNVGKYFYIDSGYINESFDTQVSTLAHEFQHMIRFNLTRENSVSDSTWFNEMMSILCEDMLQSHLELDDSDSPKNRTQNFNYAYYLCGLSEYNSSYAGYSYAVWANFGMFLARRYGGAALVQKMAGIKGSGNSVILSAINGLNGTSYTFDDLFEQYVQALLGSSDYTHNVDAATTVSYTGTDGDTSNSYSESNPYVYPMTAYDIFDDDYAFPSSAKKDYSTEKYSGYSWNGPYVRSVNYGATLRPNNGFTLHGIKKMSSTSTTVTFSSNSNSSVKLYLILL